MAQQGEVISVEDMNSYQLGYKHGYDEAETLYKEKLRAEQTRLIAIIDRQNKVLEKLSDMIESLKI